ncbi:MAG: hypothetical protein ACJAZT_000528 [Gammaproteobacteria bacterium]|jgi:hypothetical protein
MGTFLGVSIGLSEFNIGGDSSDLMKSAINLLGGMKTAFYTSLVGMFFSLIFMLLLFVTAKVRDISYGRVLANLSNQCLMVSPVSLLNNIAPANQDELIASQLEAAQSTIESNTKIGTSLNAINDSLSTFNGETIVESLTKAVHQTMSEEVTPVLVSISKEIRSLKEIKEQNGQELIENITGALKKDVIEPFDRHLSNNTDVIAKTATALEQLSDKLGDVMSGLHDTTETLNSFQKETLLKLQDFASSLREILGQFETSTETVLEKVANDIGSAINESIDGMKRQREAFESSAEIASQAFVHQNQTLENIGIESSKLMSDAKDNLLTGLSDVDAKVKSMSDVVQNELENFRLEYQQNLSSFFEQQSNLLEGALGKQREGLAAVVADFRDAFKEENDLRKKQFDMLVEHHKKQTDSVKIVRELVEAVGLTNSSIFNQIEDASNTVNKQVGLLRKEYVNASQAFNEITERMPEAIDGYLSNAKESHEQFFTNFDDAAAQVHGKLAEAANLLVTAMQQIDIQLNAQTAKAS